ncbi:MAG: hypothetical protein GY913_26900 [Proteobacteria bacterium]|nr:hypothetical protein [Pseudomonadota bacterium]MCP4920544.1 hypothetical protein [Pseudomonadota bacterium]
MSAPDVFTDMLVGQEQILAVLGAPGTPVDKAASWWQIALTDHRILAVRMTTTDSVTWHTDVRWAKDRPAVAIGQYPRTEAGQARLEVRGFPEPITLVEIDSHDVHPHIAPFLAIWAAPIDGVAAVPLSGDAPKVDEGELDQKKLMYIVGGGLGFIILCCGCGSVLALLRDVIRGLIEG